MKRDDHRAFRQCLGQLAAAFRSEVTTLMLQGYWLGLNDLSLVEVKTAARAALKRCEFMPTVAGLRELVLKDRKKPMTEEEYRALRKQERAERARILSTWEPARQLAARSEPATAAEIVDEMVARMAPKS